MVEVKNKLLVMSGKGGVGKTTIAVNLAYALSKKGLKVGLLDVDIHGPNVPKMLHLEGEKLSTKNKKIIPIKVKDNLKVMSMAFLLNKNDAVIWRGPMKHNIIKQFLEDVDWGNLDYLVIDFPPGTGDEAISIAQLLQNITGSIIIATPQQVALIDIIKAIDFSNKVNIPIIGLIENMSSEVFGGGTVKILADARKINFLGSLGLDKQISKSGDNGIPFIKNDSRSSKSFEKIIEKIISFCKEKEIA